MNLSPRQRFWLKVVLAVTAPVWFTAAIPLVFLWMLGVLLWEMATDLVSGISPECNEADQYAADDVPHPFADEDALQGHVTAPAGAQDFQVVYDEAGGESGWSVAPRNSEYNPVNQHTGD